jgi:hypothetical protein
VVVQLRGDAAKCGEGVDIRELGRRVRKGFTDEHPPWLSGVVESLRKDGLAVAEVGAAHSSEGHGGGETWVRLP